MSAPTLPIDEGACADKIPSGAAIVFEDVTM